MAANYLPIVILLSVVAFLAAKKDKLTIVAAVTGWLTGLVIYIGAGYTGVAMLATFFILGTTATSYGMSAKQNLGLAEENKGRRTAGQVIANAGIAAILCLLILLFPLHKPVLLLMVAGSISSAAADTLSSELGNVFGRRYFNILTFKPDKRGLDGVVSLEGTFAGICGSTIIAAVYCIGFGFSTHFLIVIISGIVGNLADSILGATVERKNYLGNNSVNFLNTVIGALTALIISLL